MEDRIKAQMREICILESVESSQSAGAAGRHSQVLVLRQFRSRNPAFRPLKAGKPASAKELKCFQQKNKLERLSYHPEA